MKVVSTLFESNPTSFASLPEEVQLLCFYYLGFKNFIGISSVCKKWHTIIKKTTEAKKLHSPQTKFWQPADPIDLLPEELIHHFSSEKSLKPFKLNSNSELFIFKEAIKNNDIRLIVLFLNNNAIEVNQGVGDFYFSLGEYPNIKSYMCDNMSAINLAAVHDHSDLVKFLLRRKFEFNNEISCKLYYAGDYYPHQNSKLDIFKLALKNEIKSLLSLAKAEQKFRSNDETSGFEWLAIAQQNNQTVFHDYITSIVNEEKGFYFNYSADMLDKIKQVFSFSMHNSLR